MSINIKNEEADQLARQLAEMTGETVTTAVTEALRERLARLRRERRREGLSKRLLEIGAECAALLEAARLKGDWMEAEDLYDDESGLPK
jgi:antitoxin VapB